MTKYSARVLLPDGSAFVFSDDIEKTSQGMHQGVLKNESLADTTSEVSDDIIAPLPENVNINTQLPMDDIGPTRETIAEMENAAPARETVGEDIGPVKDSVGSGTKEMYVDAKRKDPLI